MVSEQGLSSRSIWERKGFVHESNGTETKGRINSMQIEETQSNPNHRKKEGPRTYQGLAAYHRRCAAQIHPRRRCKTTAPLVREDRRSRLMAPCACGQGHRRRATRWRRPHPSVGALAGEGARGGAAPSSGRHGWPPLRARLHVRCAKRSGQGGEKKE